MSIYLSIYLSENPLTSGLPLKPAPSKKKTWTCQDWLLLEDKPRRECWGEEPSRPICRTYNLLGHQAVLFLQCTSNIACFNIVELNFLLKEHDFPFQRSQLCSLPSCRGQGQCCLILHTRPLTPATWDAITVTNCKIQPQLIYHNNWAWTWHFYDLLVHYCGFLSLIFVLMSCNFFCLSVVKRLKKGLLRAGFFFITRSCPCLSILGRFKFMLIGRSPARQSDW